MDKLLVSAVFLEWMEHSPHLSSVGACCDAREVLSAACLEVGYLGELAVFQLVVLLLEELVLTVDDLVALLVALAAACDDQAVLLIIFDIIAFLVLNEINMLGCAPA